MHTGSCLCGGITYQISGALAPIQMCHCSQCRKAQGTALATNTPVDNDRYTITQGAELVNEYESSAGKFRAFCKVCGSPMYSRLASLPGVLRVRAGTLNGELDASLAFHVFTEDKANWWPILDGLPQHAKLP